jgi:polyphosphate kinase 2 (PPK2 family)
MFEQTDTELAPWMIIDANKKTHARIEAIKYILDNIPYKKATTASRKRSAAQ